MATCLVVLAAFLNLARQHLPGLAAVWWGLAAFFGLRAAQSVPRAWHMLGGGGGDSSNSINSGSSWQPA